MKVQVIGFGRKGRVETAEIVVRKDDGRSITRHVWREADGRYHWRVKGEDENGNEVEISHESYSL